MKHKRYYEYLIAYNFEKDGYLTHCSGTMCLSRVNKINNFDEVKSVVDFITNSIEGAKNVSVYNIIHLGRTRH
jgi:hypothetical protein